MFIAWLCLFFYVTVTHQLPSKPNIIWIVTDDQDQMLGSSFPEHNGVTPMPKTRELMANQGSTALNFFVHTPICSPSRSELISGRYFHNIKRTGLDSNAMHVNYTLVNDNTFAKHLKNEAGYTVGMFGKYLNVVPNTVPEGFDAWMANGGGDYISPSFNTKNLGFVNISDGKWKGTEENYTTSVVGNVSTAWIETVANQGKPFFAYIAPKAAHEPFNPAPWYVDHWDSSWPKHEPRPVAWNCSVESRADHHGVIATQPMLTEEAANVVTDVFKNRWRTLMSVDDLIADVFATCQKLGVLDNTYIFYSSDHGFQLGEFNILMDKRQMYDWNTRVHLLAVGPGISKGSEWSKPATMVDMAPTFLGLAGLPKPAQMDGKSLVPFLVRSNIDPVPKSTKKHLRSLPAFSEYAAGWRDSVLIEYYFVSPNIKCVANCNGTFNWPHSDTNCGDLPHNSQCWGTDYIGCSKDCHFTESNANNYIALRSISETSIFGNVLYAEFQKGSQYETTIEFNKVDFHEYYNVTADPWQMKNTFKSLPQSEVQALHSQLHRFFGCAGSSCP